MSTHVVGLKSSALVVIASAVAGCYTPIEDDRTLTAASASQTESSADDDGTLSATTDTPSTSSPTTDADTAPADGSESTDEGSSDDHSGSSSGSTAGTDTTTGDPVACGDGIVDEGEECDDANDEDADACSNACVAGFYTGTLDPCTALGETMCGYFEAQCRRDPDGGELAQLCYWPQGSPEDACGTTPGIWTTPDSGFALAHDFDFPTDGACITQIGNLDCSAADEQACGDAGGALCFHEVGPVGEQIEAPPLCWWDVDQPGCDAVPGIWTTADSGFGQGHPKSLPPSGAATCILQVPFI
jgi:cysteine-rich repeat protein